MKTEFLTNGLFTDYYENGQIMAEGHYKGSNRNGKWIF
jgi:antitoxin component YwqK of YwqJK toxin-antitoxin module